MREILFRGQRLDNGEWVEGFYIEDKWGDSSGNELHGILQDRTCPPGLADWTPVPVQKETVGEYTGLTDKNGRRIFEGDILFSAVDLDGDGVLSKELLTVYFDKKLAGFLLKSNQSKIPCEIENCAGMEIVGNTHDNPELLEVEE